MIASQYQVGDRVSFLGAIGTITGIETNPYAINTIYPITVKMDSGRAYHFTSNGMPLQECTVPALEILERPKQKVKKYLWAYKSANGYWSVTTRHCTASEMLEWHHHNEFTCIEQSEIEEEA